MSKGLTIESLQLEFTRGYEKVSDFQFQNINHLGQVFRVATPGTLLSGRNTTVNPEGNIAFGLVGAFGEKTFDVPTEKTVVLTLDVDKDKSTFLDNNDFKISKIVGAGCSKTDHPDSNGFCPQGTDYNFTFTTS